MFNKIQLFVIIAALGMVLAIGIAGPGTRLGLWEYGTGVTILKNIYIPSLLAAAITILVFIVSLFRANRNGVKTLLFVTAVAVSGAAVVPYMFSHRISGNPYIHDITTDFESPPQITAAANLDRNNPAAYVGAEPAPNSDLTIAEAQQAAYPDIKPLYLPASVEDTTRMSLDVIRQMNMTVLSESTEASTVTIEAAFKSRWFGFVDDFIVRIRPDGDKSRVDIRSKSRVGRSDLGANAQRIRDFSNNLKK